MRPTNFVALCSTIAVALAAHSPIASQERSIFDPPDDYSCYTPSNIIAFNALCPNSNWPIENDRGLDVMGVLYFALLYTNIPDDTIYTTGENIVCTVNDRTPNITVSLDARAGNSIVSGGGSVTFSLTAPNFAAHSVCLFTEGYDEAEADPITLRQARNLLYDMLTLPHSNCKVCGRIPVRWPNVTHASKMGGLLKSEVVGSNNCLGKCVGPNSFNVTAAQEGAFSSDTSSTTSSTNPATSTIATSTTISITTTAAAVTSTASSATSTTSAPAASPTSGAMGHLQPLGSLFGLGMFTYMTTAWILG